MNLRDEINVLHYRCALQLLAEEIRTGFPLLRRFQVLTVPRLLAFLERQPGERQLKYTQALLKRRHQDALRLVGDAFTVEDQMAFEECSRAILIPTAAEMALDLQGGCFEHSPGKVKHCRARVLEDLKPILGANTEQRAAGWWIYRTEIRDWIIETELDLAGRGDIWSYHHDVGTKTQARLKENISLLSLLGICGGDTSWSSSSPDLAVAVEAITTFCRVYIEQATQFLP